MKGYLIWSDWTVLKHHRKWLYYKWKCKIWLSDCPCPSSILTRIHFHLYKNQHLQTSLKNDPGCLVLIVNLPQLAKADHHINIIMFSVLMLLKRPICNANVILIITASHQWKHAANNNNNNNNSMVAPISCK